MATGYKNYGYNKSRGSTAKTYWREDPTQTFVNPYNFVSLGDGVSRTVPTKGTISGKIDCTLTLRTPLCLPDAETKTLMGPADLEHYYYRFMRVNGVPFIPGSELRGVFRSAFECVSNSCLSVNNNNTLSARHSAPRQPGLIEFRNGTWTLYAASAKMIRDGHYPKEDDNTCIRTWVSAPNNKNRNRTSDFIFHREKDEVKCEGLDKAVDNYNKCVDIYRKNNSKYDTIAQYLKKDGRPHPVYYEAVSDYAGHEVVYLAPAAMSRSVFDHTLDDLLGPYSHCTDSDSLCTACALFGMIGEKNKGAVASRVRFSDAFPTEEISDDKLLTKMTLKELAGPKTTSVEFYTKRPRGALAWSYDYKTIDYRNGSKSQTEPERELLTGEQSVKIRGRKFFLHSKPDYVSQDRTKRNITTDLIPAETAFRFSVYVDNVTEQELQQLVWLLCLGENRTEGIYCVKVGHGKPYGLGSAKVTVDAVMQREFDGVRYALKSREPETLLAEIPFDAKTTVFREFMQICDFTLTDGMRVSYPIADDCRNSPNSRASHQWFIGNRSSLNPRATQTAWNLKYVLPSLGDELRLPALRKDALRRNSGSPFSAVAPRHSTERQVESVDNNGDMVEVTCVKCGISGKISRASYEKLTSFGIGWQCDKCRK